MLYTNIQPCSFLGSGKEELNFLSYMGMAAILINGPRPFVQMFNPPLTEGFRRTLKKIGLEVSSEKLFKGVGSGELKTH